MVEMSSYHERLQHPSLIVSRRGTHRLTAVRSNLWPILLRTMSLLVRRNLQQLIDNPPATGCAARWPRLPRSGILPLAGRMLGGFRDPLFGCDREYGHSLKNVMVGPAGSARAILSFVSLTPSRCASGRWTMTILMFTGH